MYTNFDRLNLKIVFLAIDLINYWSENTILLLPCSRHTPILTKLEAIIKKERRTTKKQVKSRRREGNDKQTNKQGSMSCSKKTIKSSHN